MIGGFRGRLLRADLTEKKVSVEPIDERLFHLYLGGRGLGAKLLWDELAPGIDPLSPQNKLIFTPGPLQGTGTLESGRDNLSTKSPLTGIYLYSNAGGNFGAYLKKSGYDSLIVQGASDEPVYLNIENEHVEFRSAKHLWALMTDETQARLREELGNKFIEVVCIGPAGERQVLVSSIIEGERAFARGGSGAIMGAKKLKAITIFSKERVPIADQQAFKTAQATLAKLLHEDIITGKVYPKYGTQSVIPVLSEIGMLPSLNWRQGTFADVESLFPENYREKYVTRDHGCPNCSIHCGKTMHVKDGPHAGAEGRSPEFETSYAFGSACGIGKMDAIIHADMWCDKLGVDTMSTGLTIAFAMECAEKGLIPEVHNGVRLAFGDDLSTVKLVKMMGLREGIGDLLADGSMRMAEKIGGISHEFAMHSKGLEFGGYDPRRSPTQAIQYACSPRGGCHHDLGNPALKLLGHDNLSVEEMGQKVRELAEKKITYDSAIICAFAREPLELDKPAKVLSAVTGVEFNEGRLKETGYRVQTLERCFNVREGIRREHDRLPKRLLEEALRDEKRISYLMNLEELKDAFYSAMGWDVVTGIPTRETLKTLQLGEVAEYFSRHGIA